MTKRGPGNPRLDLHRNTDTTAALAAKSKNSLKYSVYVVGIVFDELDKLLGPLSDIDMHPARKIRELGITKAQLVRELNANRRLLPRHEWTCRIKCSRSCGKECIKGNSRGVTQQGLTRALRYAADHVVDVAAMIPDRRRHIPSRDTGVVLTALIFRQPTRNEMPSRNCGRGFSS